MLLCLSSSDLTIPFIFVHDLQNYVQLMPEYCAQIHELKIANLEILQFFRQGNSSANKSP